MNGVGARESNDGTSRLRLRGPTAIHAAVTAARALGERTGIGEADAARLAILVEELVTNLYDHGGLKPDDMFELEMTSGDGEVGLVLVAPGKEFDPTVGRKRADSSAKGAGAGLKLLRAWSRRTDYRYVDGRNRLELLLPLADS